MTYTRQNENSVIVSSIIPQSIPLVTDGELEPGVFVEKEQLKYSKDKLYKANESSWSPSYTEITNTSFVPDCNDEDLFEYVYTVPAGDISTYNYSWRKPFTVNFTETYLVSPGVYGTRNASRNIAVSFRTELKGVKITYSGWNDSSKFYYSDTFTNSIIIEANDNVKIGSIINGNTVTNIVKGSLYHYVEFSGSNAFSSSLYGDVNVLCGLGIKNKFGVIGWYFSENKKIKIIPEFNAKLKNQFNKFIPEAKVLNVNDYNIGSVYENCFSELGATRLKNIVKTIYEPARRLNSSLNFNTFENTWIGDGETLNFIEVQGNGTKNTNYIDIDSSLNIPIEFRGELRLSVNEENLNVVSIVNNRIYLSGNLQSSFRNKRIIITKNFVLRKFRDLPASSDRLKFLLNDFNIEITSEDENINKKNYNSIFGDFEDSTGLFTVDYYWSLLPCKEPNLIDVDSTSSSVPGGGTAWSYPSTDDNGNFYIEGVSNEQYRININKIIENNYFKSATITGVFTSVSNPKLFGDDFYKSIEYEDVSGELYTEYFYDYKRSHLIPMTFNIGNITKKITDYTKYGKLFDEPQCFMIEGFSKIDTTLKVDTTEDFKSTGWLVIPKYSTTEDFSRTYELKDWEVVYYNSKTNNSFNITKRGCFETEIFDFNLTNSSETYLNYIPIVQFNGYGSVND